MRPETFEKAQVIMQNRRRNIIVENDRRTDEVNQKIPAIRAVNEELFNTGKRIIGIIGECRRAGETEAQINQKIDRLKHNNLDAQNFSRILLVQNGFPADYLDIKYNCDKCSDTGYINGEMCECFKRLCGKLEADEINRHSNLELSSFDTFYLTYYIGEDFETMKNHLTFLKNYAENFKPDSHSILMYGQTGLGKTHLSLAIANRVLEKGYSVIYDSAINILLKIEEEHFSYNHKAETLNLIMQTDLLIIDDLGTENETTFCNSTIYNIINTRINYRKPVIISTNLDLDEIKERYDKRITSRLTTKYATIEFCGTDVRWQKRYGNKKR